MQVGNISIIGHGVSGVESCFIIPELGVVFDIGFCPPEAVKYRTVFVTHGHPDHLTGAVQHAATRSLRNLEPSRFVVPPALVPGLRSLFDCWNSFQNHPFETEIVALAPGERIAGGAKGLVVEAFATDHTMPSQGYVVTRVTQKLKEQYIGLPGAEIGRLRKEGVEVTVTTETPEFAYTGDTRPTVFDRVEVLSKVRTLLTEATFLTPDTVEMAKTKGHTHLSELVALAPRLAWVDHLVLTHFSQRHNDEEIAQILNGTVWPDTPDVRTTHVPEEDP